MRKRYRQGRDVPMTCGLDLHPLAMGDGTFVLISSLEALQGITPNEILAQEAQEEAARPGPVSQSPGGDGLHSILAETYPQWRARELKAPTRLDKAIADAWDGFVTESNAMKRIAERTMVVPSDPSHTPEDFLMDPERASECLRVGRIYVNCLFCGHIGDATSDEAGRALLKEHVASVAHDRAYEARLRENVENARTALYDYLKSKGRVA